MKESEMYTSIKGYFETRGYDVYSEVMFGKQGGKRADLVAVKNGEITVVEMKLSMGLKVMEQAEQWKGIANYIYIAVLNPKNTNRFAEKILGMLNIGIMYLGQSEYFDFDKNDFYFDIRTLIIPNYEKIDDHKVGLWKQYITEEHKNNLPGGSSGGGYITAYTRTIAKVKKYLEENGESTIE